MQLRLSNLTELAKRIKLTSKGNMTLGSGPSGGVGIVVNGDNNVALCLGGKIPIGTCNPQVIGFRLFTDLLYNFTPADSLYQVKVDFELWVDGVLVGVTLAHAGDDVPAVYIEDLLEGYSDNSNKWAGGWLNLPSGEGQFAVNLNMGKQLPIKIVPIKDANASNVDWSAWLTEYRQSLTNNIQLLTKTQYLEALGDYTAAFDDNDGLTEDIESYMVEDGTLEFCISPYGVYTNPLCELTRFAVLVDDEDHVFLPNFSDFDIQNLKWEWELGDMGGSRYVMDNGDENRILSMIKMDGVRNEEITATIPRRVIKNIGVTKSSMLTLTPKVTFTDAISDHSKAMAKFVKHLRDTFRAYGIRKEDFVNYPDLGVREFIDGSLSRPMFDNDQIINNSGRISLCITPAAAYLGAIECAGFDTVVGNLRNIEISGPYEITLKVQLIPGEGGTGFTRYSQGDATLSERRFTDIIASVVDNYYVDTYTFSETQADVHLGNDGIPDELISARILVKAKPGKIVHTDLNGNDEGMWSINEDGSEWSCCMRVKPAIHASPSMLTLDGAPGSVILSYSLNGELNTTDVESITNSNPDLFTVGNLIKVGNNEVELTIIPIKAGNGEIIINDAQGGNDLYIGINVLPTVPVGPTPTNFTATWNAAYAKVILDGDILNGVPGNNVTLGVTTPSGKTSTTPFRYLSDLKVQRTLFAFTEIGEHTFTLQIDGNPTIATATVNVPDQKLVVPTATYTGNGGYDIAVTGANSASINRINIFRSRTPISLIDNLDQYLLTTIDGPADSFSFPEASRNGKWYVCAFAGSSFQNEMGGAVFFEYNAVT